MRMGEDIVQSRENINESTEKLCRTRSGWLWRNQTKIEESKKAKEWNVIKICKMKIKKLNIKANNGDTSWLTVIECRWTDIQYINSFELFSDKKSGLKAD